LQYSHTASLVDWNNAAVRAFFNAISIDARTAPSMRVKAFRWTPASTTAMITGTPIVEALASAAATMARACDELSGIMRLRIQRTHSRLQAMVHVVKCLFARKSTRSASVVAPNRVTVDTATVDRSSEITD
jgi:hypothetical protein